MDSFFPCVWVTAFHAILLDLIEKLPEFAEVIMLLYLAESVVFGCILTK